MLLPNLLTGFLIITRFPNTGNNGANPVKLLSWLKKIEEMLSLKDQCRELPVAKQDLIDEAKIAVVANRSMLRGLEVSTGIPVTNDSEYRTYASFDQVKFRLSIT